VEAALAMLGTLDGIQDELRERGWPAVNVGIGINTGMINVGDMGSEYRRAYTVIGDAVNLGSRLEGLTKYYGVRLIVSETTATNLKGMALRCLDRVRVKGKHEPVTIYEPVGTRAGISADKADEIRESNEALENYFAGNWDKARAGFKALQAAEPEDKFYRLYLERITTLQSQGIGEGWDGVFTHTSK